jgi:hypothetical protein
MKNFKSFMSEGRDEVINIGKGSDVWLSKDGQDQLNFELENRGYEPGVDFIISTTEFIIINKKMIKFLKGNKFQIETPSGKAVFRDLWYEYNEYDYDNPALNRLNPTWGNQKRDKSIPVHDHMKSKIKYPKYFAGFFVSSWGKMQGKKFGAEEVRFSLDADDKDFKDIVLVKDKGEIKKLIEDLGNKVAGNMYIGENKKGIFGYGKKKTKLRDAILKYMENK